MHPLCTNSNSCPFIFHFHNSKEFPKYVKYILCSSEIKFHTTECHIWNRRCISISTLSSAIPHPSWNNEFQHSRYTLGFTTDFFFAILVATTTIKTTPYLIRSENREMECMQWRYSLVFQTIFFYRSFYE